ncbi:hypothetical protein GUITHDRAFT_142113 [Guillardia theta CCMP2712]|uniref:Uncharacterized protein n=1 Tax=Guillardia theta (strain CCMP2712) TaxID=905079 RepID=L1IY57_GUITC|nr:hypothetical protein GUITHDRAFT_142113 [Guillardia theta CCMP2712]EKX41176.1 hypothetical protein GUITHDRAFT_142113 [Guillardia theta CCMP2712]|eukprot:XP_005828156.1 hypothetical protein GUITHDRAFT_142113 [Guillardia theta CCMP2712]
MSGEGEEWKSNRGYSMGSECSSPIRGAGNNRYGDDAKRKHPLASSRRDCSSFTRVGGQLPTHAYKVDYFLNPHLDPNCSTRPVDRDRVWDPKTRRLSRLSELDPSDFLHTPAKTVEEEKRELWELFESAKAVGAVVETKAPEAEQPRRKSSLMEAERMRDALMKLYEEEITGGYVLKARADEGGERTVAISGAELMMLERGGIAMGNHSSSNRTECGRQGDGHGLASKACANQPN